MQTINVSMPGLPTTPTLRPPTALPDRSEELANQRREVERQVVDEQRERDKAAELERQRRMPRTD